MDKGQNFRFQKMFPSFSAIGLLLVLLMATVIPVVAAVTLVSFTATPGNGQVLVAWVTATEFDNAGFFVYRSLNQTSGFTAISPFIPATGGGPTGGQYSYLDTNVSNGTAYYYELVAISSSNATESFSPVGPIIPGVATATATLNSIATRTPTATNPTSVRTATLTRTPTPPHNPTATQSGAYPGPLQSPSPNLNPTQNQTTYPGPVASPSANGAQTPGAEATSINQLAQEGGITSTLRPFPSITIEYPDPTETPGALIQSTAEPGDNGLSGWVNMARLGPLALILLVWILLGGWFYLTLRRLD
jgi:hypothetical protein